MTDEEIGLVCRMAATEAIGFLRRTRQLAAEGGRFEIAPGSLAAWRRNECLATFVDARGLDSNRILEAAVKIEFAMRPDVLGVGFEACYSPWAAPSASGPGALQLASEEGLRDVVHDAMMGWGIPRNTRLQPFVLAQPFIERLDARTIEWPDSDWPDSELRPGMPEGIETGSARRLQQALFASASMTAGLNLASLGPVNLTTEEEAAIVEAALFRSLAQDGFLVTTFAGDPGTRRYEIMTALNGKDGIEANHERWSTADSAPGKLGDPSMN